MCMRNFCLYKQSDFPTSKRSTAQCFTSCGLMMPDVNSFVPLMPRVVLFSEDETENIVACRIWIFFESQFKFANTNIRERTQTLPMGMSPTFENIFTIFSMPFQRWWDGYAVTHSILFTSRSWEIGCLFMMTFEKSNYVSLFHIYCLSQSVSLY